MQNQLYKFILWVLVIGLFQPGFAQTTYTSTDVPVTITDASPIIVNSTLDISTTNECVTDINVVGLDISHTWTSDLVISLTSPTGTTITLLDQICGSTDDIDVDLDDSGSSYSNISSNCPIDDGDTYAPLEALANFVGEDIDGTWTLTVEDLNSWDGGTINGWGLEITTEPCSAPSGACDEDTPFYTADLSEEPDMGYISPEDRRDGLCCDEVSTSPPVRCIEFEVFLHPNAIGIEFGIFSGAEPSGSMFYTVDCGEQTPVGDQLCLDGAGPFTITFCKPGNNTNEYYIQSIPSTAESTDVTTLSGCGTPLEVRGIEESTAIWQDITSGTSEYNSYLSCTTGCLNPTFLDDGNGPPFIDYEVCGETDVDFCTDAAPIVCDTIRVTLVPDFQVLVNPYPVVFCEGTIYEPTVTASATINSYPLDFTWYDGPNGSGNVISDTTSFDATTAGTYSVVVTHTEYGACSDEVFNVDVVVTTCTEDCDNGLDDDYDGFVDEYDDDCPCEDDQYYGQCEPDCEYIPSTLPNFRYCGRMDK